MRRIATFIFLFVLAATGFTTVLYEAAISKTRPDRSKWGWFYLSLPTRAKVTAPGGSGFVTLDTTSSIKIQAGWGKQLTAKLDRRVGYTATWRMKLVREEHSKDGQRAGLSVFVLSDDHYGIEVGYWNDRIFVYNDNKTFTPAEFVPFDPRSKLRTYRLSVHGDRYTLNVDGLDRLSGKLRNYSFFGFPYTRPNSIWYGDDTTRGESVSQWAEFQVSSASLR
ncbi:MAG TPA: hypothetical protein VKT78_10575 [Fimbriimonadaceae bacterium]|nr:hypothetical protein [Fimbriimonadaceae bacterium]